MNCPINNLIFYVDFFTPCLKILEILQVTSLGAKHFQEHPDLQDSDND